MLPRELVSLATLSILGASVHALQIRSDGFSGDSCRPPVSRRVIDSGHALDNLVGDYRLIVVGDRNVARDTIAVGHLSVLGAVHHGPASRNRDISFPAWGWSDIDLHVIGPLSLAYQPSSQNPRRPGVQVIRNSADSTLTLVFGNAFSAEGNVAEDAGVFFDLVEVDAQGMRGRWRDGGRRTPRPTGYFCAYRLGATPNVR